MAIAAHPIIADQASWSDLPADVDVLFELSKLSAEAFRDALGNGDIYADMALRDARLLVRTAAEWPPDRRTRGRQSHSAPCRAALTPTSPANP